MEHHHNNVNPIFMVSNDHPSRDLHATINSLGSKCCSLPDDAERAAKAALHFPCDFVIKAIGLQADDLLEHVHALIVKHDPELTLDRMSTRASGKGKYLSISANVRATSRPQLDAIYQALTDDPRILYTL